MNWTYEDYCSETDLHKKIHILFDLLQAYDFEVHAEIMSHWDTESLMIQQFGLENQGREFQAEYGDAGVFVLMGIYEGFSTLMAGYNFGACPSEVIISYGMMMVAFARPYYNIVRNCGMMLGEDGKWIGDEDS